MKRILQEVKKDMGGSYLARQVMKKSIEFTWRTLIPAKVRPTVSNKFCIVIIPIANHEKSFTKWSLCDRITPGKKLNYIA